MAPRQFVNPPLFTPSPFGLLSAVDFPTPEDEHWESGIIYQPVCSTPQSTYDECIAITGSGGAPPPPPYITNSVNVTPRIATPFEVVMEFDCAAVGMPDAATMEKAAFDSSESWQVERSFWSGIAATQTVVFPHLAANAVVTDPMLLGTGGGTVSVQTAAVVVSGSGGSGGAANIGEVLGLIEEGIGNCYSGVGIIHVPVKVLDTMAANGLVTRQGSRLYTPNGNKIAAGNGYPGTAPNGSAPPAGSSWIYGTGNAFCYRSEPFTTEDRDAFDRRTNTKRMQTRRRYCLGWDCCHFAGLVSGLGVPKGT
jgi:hypothetical protein